MKGRRPVDDVLPALAPLAGERTIWGSETVDDRSAEATTARDRREGAGLRGPRLGAWLVGLALIATAIGVAVRSADEAPGASPPSSVSPSSAPGASVHGASTAPTLPPTNARSSTEQASVTRLGPVVVPRDTPSDGSGPPITGSPSIGAPSIEVPTPREPHGPYLLAPTGARLLVAADGDLVEISLDTGEERTIAENLGEELYPGCCMVHDGWFVTVSGRPALAVPLTGGEPVSLGDACGGFPSATPGRWWVHTCTEDGSPDLREVTLATGTVTGEARPPVGSRVWFAVPDGLVIGAGGGVYIGRDGDFRLVATGRVDGVRGGALLLSECDEQLRCTTTRFDPSTGERRATSVFDGLNGPQVSFGEPVSAEAAGRQVVVVYADGAPEYQIFDRTAGELVGIPGEGGQLGAAALSSDGQWVFWSEDSLVVAWHIGDLDTIPIDLDGRTLISGY